MKKKKEKEGKIRLGSCKKAAKLLATNTLGFENSWKGCKCNKNSKKIFTNKSRQINNFFILYIMKLFGLNQYLFSNSSCCINIYCRSTTCGCMKSPIEAMTEYKCR